MRILDIKLFKGRNIYNHKPVAKLTVDLGRHNDTPTNQITNFNQRLLEAFPNLKKHTCSLGYEGGFLQRLERGTYLAHVLEHVLIEIQNMLGYKVKYGKTREDSQEVFNIFFEYENPDFAISCCKEGVKIINSFIFDRSANVEECLEKLAKIKYETDFGLSTQAIINQAKKRGIPVTRIGDQNLIRLNYGKKARFVQATLLDLTSCIAVDIASDKNLTKSILDNLQIPVPEGYVVSSPAEAFERALDIDAPVVIKPLNSNQGKGVRTDLYSKQEITTSFDIASNFSRKVIVEKFIKGHDYRVLVVGNKVSAVAKRLPAAVEGDGKSTIKQLIQQVNSHPSRGYGHEKPLTKIEITDKTHDVLYKQNYTLSHIPKSGEKVLLCENCNLSTGGTAEDFTDQIHPENAALAVKSARAIGIDIAGVDFIAQDISKPITETGGAIIEVNAAPGIRMHLHPSKGTPRDVAKDILDYIYPDPTLVNFPIVSVTGTNGKTTTVRLVSHILQQNGNKVGLTSTSGTFINNNCIAQGDHAGASSARSLLCNTEIDAAVLETARGSIIKKGLGYDLADVGIITNIAEDHLGCDNVHTLEDLAHVKSLVVEALKPNGFAVLNAEDQSTAQIKNTVHENIIYFYLNKNNLKVDTKHNACVYFENNKIIISDKGQQTEVASVKKIPLTLNGLVKCNILNCLAAVAATYVLNVPIKTIKKGLETFKNNSGRFELYEFDSFKIILDYAHNHHGASQLFALSKSLPHSRLVGVVGMPGDRQDEDYKKVAQLCAQTFDYIYIKEDQEVRTRKAGEVSEIFYNNIVKNDFEKQNIKIINHEVDALKSAIKNHQQGDLIVVMYENLQPLKSFITHWKNNNQNLSQTPPPKHFSEED